VDHAQRPKGFHRARRAWAALHRASDRHRQGRAVQAREFVADDYSIADIAIWPWVSRYEWQTVDLSAYANVKRWYTVIARRPAVQRGYKVPKDVGEIPMP
jgi:glutathione S-transferase